MLNTLTTKHNTKGRYVFCCFVQPWACKFTTNILKIGEKAKVGAAISVCKDTKIILVVTAVYIPTPYSFKMYFNIILLFSPRSPNLSRAFRFSDYNIVFLISSMRATCLAHSILLHLIMTNLHPFAVPALSTYNFPI